MVPDQRPVSVLSLTDGRAPGYVQFSTGKWPLAMIVHEAWVLHSTDMESFVASIDSGWRILGKLSTSISVRDFLDLSQPLARYGRYPMWSLALPWSDNSMSQIRRTLPRKIVRNRRTNGLPIRRFLTREKVMKMDAEHSGKSHAIQFWHLLNSINNDGFWSGVNASDPLTAVNLVDNKSQSWILRSGTHRSISALTLGYEEIPAQIVQTVKRCEAPAWPNVKNRVYSVHQALEIFDRYMAGHQSKRNQELLSELRNLWPKA